MMSSMSTADLLKLSPDQLLTSRSLAECVAVGEQLGREVDRKREELRVMVGERYRDLIEAADTIQNMKLTASKVIDSVEGMRSSCKHLQQQAAISCLTSAGEPVAPKESPNQPYLAVAASTKLLMVVPERIWGAVELGKRAEAAQLFLLAQYVHTGLEGGAGGGLTPEKISAWFPVVARQWATVRTLHASLLARARKDLSNLTLNEKDASDSLLAILLLRGCRLSDLFQEYLSLRREAASEVLLAGRAQAARAALSGTVKTIVDTLTIGHCLFLKDGLKNALIQMTEAGPSLSLLGTSALGPMEARLTQTARCFRPKMDTIETLEKDDIRKGISSWLQEIGAGAKSESVSLLQFVDSVQAVSGVREELKSTLTAQIGWSQVAEEVVQSPVSLWDSIYREVLTGRVLDLLADRMNSLGDSTREGVMLMLQAEGEEECMWKEGIKDTGGERCKEQLEAKCRGWGARVQEVLATLEHGLAALWTETRLYCQEEGEEGQVFDRFKDSNYIREGVGEVVSKVVSSLVSDCKLEASKNGGSHLLQLGRFLQVHILTIICKKSRRLLTGHEYPLPISWNHSQCRADGWNKQVARN